MKKKEKIVILVLLAITIVLVVVGVKMKSPDNSEKEKTSKVNSSQNGDNANTNDEESEKEQYVVYLDDGTKVNSSENLKKDKDIKGMTLSSIQLTEKDNMTVLIANLKNTTKETKKDVAFNIVLLDEAGNEMVVLPAYIQEVKAGETEKINTQVSGDYSNAYNFKIAE